MKLSSIRHLSLLLTMYFITHGSLSYSYSQTINPSIAKLKWNATHASNLDKPDDSFAFVCEFVTNGNADIQWMQHGAAGTSEFTVISVTGDWNNISNPGEIIFNVSQDNVSGTIKIRRNSNSKIELLLDMGEDSRYAFAIKDYTIIN